MQVTKARHAYPEKKGFSLARKNNMGEYILIHFHQPVRLTIGDATYNTKPNAFVVIDKNAPNKIESPERDLLHDWAHLTGNVEESLASFDLKVNEVYYPQNAGFVSDIMSKIEGELFENETYKTEVVDALLSVLFALVSRNNAKKTDGFAVDYQTETDFKNLRTMVFSNLERDWSVAHMAETVNLSESRFYVLYKHIFKTTPNQDLVVARMEYAKRLLSQNRNVPVLDVAQKCGYSNEFHFIRTFKKNVGLTPKKYALLFSSQNKKNG